MRSVTVREPAVVVHRSTARPPVGAGSWRCRYCGERQSRVVEHILERHPDSDGARVFRVQGAAPLTDDDRRFLGEVAVG